MQAFAQAAASEERLFVTRLKSIGSILKELGIAIVVLAIAGFLLGLSAAPWWAWPLVVAVLLGYTRHKVLLALPGLFRRSITDAPGTATWADLEDLQKAGMIGKSVNPRHHIYCGLFDGKPVYSNDDRHIVTLGATRRGKDTGLLVQALAQLDESFVVLDPSGELAAITLNARKRKGLTFVLNPFGVLTRTHPHLKSTGFNPLLNFSPDDPEFFARTSGIGESIVPRGSVKDSHWDEGSIALGSVLIMFEKWLEKEGKVPHASMRHVNEMLTTPYVKKGARGLKGIMQEISNHHDRQMAGMTPRFIAADDNPEVRGVIATAAGKTKFLNDRTLLADMDRHPMIRGRPFDFAMLKDEIITVYIILPDDMLRTHAVWLRLVVSSAINSLKRGPPGKIRPILLLNEIGNLGYMESLDTAIGMIAKKGVKVWSAFQSMSQISRIYGEHGRETFLSGAGVLNSFKADDWETAEYLSKRLGRRTEVVSSHTAGSASISKTDHATGFPLMHPDQIMTLPPRELLCWIDRLPHPVKLTAPGYFDLPWIKGLDPNPYYVVKKP